MVSQSTPLLLLASTSPTVAASFETPVEAIEARMTKAWHNVETTDRQKSLRDLLAPNDEVILHYGDAIGTDAKPMIVRPPSAARSYSIRQQSRPNVR